MSALTVWKYTLQPGSFCLNGPIKKIVAVGLDPATGDPAAWCEVQGDSETAVRLFVAGTGMAIPPDHVHVGTIVGHQGQFVWHVYQYELF